MQRRYSKFSPPYFVVTYWFLLPCNEDNLILSLRKPKSSVGCQTRHPSKNQLLPMAGKVKSFHRHLPVPPVQQITNLQLLLWIIQEVQDTFVKLFRICHGVR